MEDNSGKNIVSCPHCHAPSGKKHSISRNGKQVFICTNKYCSGKNRNNRTGKTYFTEKAKEKFSDEEKAFLTAILALIKMNRSPTADKFIEIDILTKLKETDISIKDLKNLKFEIKSFEKNDINNYKTFWNRAKKIDCFNPRIIICQDGNKISFIKLPLYDFEK